jgi:hypothetical protein
LKKESNPLLDQKRSTLRRMRSRLNRMEYKHKLECQYILKGIDMPPLPIPPIKSEYDDDASMREDGTGGLIDATTGLINEENSDGFDNVY